MRALVFGPILSAMVFISAAAPTEYVGFKHVAVWDCVTHDVDGQADTIAGYELALLPAGKDLNSLDVQAIKRVTTPALPCEFALATFLPGMPAGAYRVQVRAVDAAGNWSAWSTPIDVTIDLTPPKPPTGLGCKLLQ